MRPTVLTSLVTAIALVVIIAAPATARTTVGSDGTYPGAGADAVAAADEPALVPAASFKPAEKTLLRAVPKRIRPTCVPRRSGLPRGTVAALQCRPPARMVRAMAYFLLDGDAAERVFERVREQARASEGRRCVSGKPGVSYWIGGMPTSELCYRNARRIANLRFLEPATRCRQLAVAGRTLETPTVYVAVRGRGPDIGKLARWATDDGRARPSVLTRRISQPGSPFSPACPT